MEKSGAEISWQVTDAFSEEEEGVLYELPGVDYVIALDDNSLTIAGRGAAANNLHGALVYGIGNSTEALYFLDIGYAECVVVPDKLNVGYQSVGEVLKRVRTLGGKTQEFEVSHTAIRRDTLFSEENQEILFTMSQ